MKSTLHGLTKVVRCWPIGLSALLILALAPTADGEGGLVGHWKLDADGGGGIVADVAGRSLDGRFVRFDKTDAAMRIVPGKIGQAVRLSGDGSIQLDMHASTLGKLTDFTVSMWIQYDGGPSRQLFSFTNGTLTHRIELEVHNNALGFGWQNGGNFRNFMTKPLSWEPGTWYHVVFTNSIKRGKSILRSNDLVWKIDGNTLSPAGLKSAVKRVEIGSVNDGEHKYVYNGCVDDVRLFDLALPLPEQLALYEASKGTPDDPRWVAAKTAMLEKHHRLITAMFEKHRRAEIIRRAQELFYTEEAPHLGKSVLQRKVDWLFQAEDDDLFTRAGKEIVWTREMIDRLQKRADAPDLTRESAALKNIEQRARADKPACDASKIRRLYFDVRALKRNVMFKFPEIDFSGIICVDAPYTQRSLDSHGTFRQMEWVHESRFRSEMCASHGAKLIVVEDFASTPAPHKLAPADDFGQPVAMFSFDLSFDGEKALFCMKPEDEKAYHLYEIGLDGNNFRQVTSGDYSDIDPIYLPSDHYLFLSTRADSYAQCGTWARSYIVTRCDSDGKNIIILSPATEPDYSPALLADGRIIWTRWEYVDKFANRIQSLWTMRPDGTGAAAFWGNQTVHPDHLGEARQIPGTTKVLFSGFGHHDVWVGCIGIVDPKKGRDFPDGIWKVTQELPWPEVGDGPIPTPGLTKQYHTSGKYAGYKTPYPLSEELFLVSVRTGNPEGLGQRTPFDPNLGLFKLYLMDIYGNRELIYEGDKNVL